METVKKSSSTPVCEFDLDGVLWIQFADKQAVQLDTWAASLNEAEKHKVLAAIECVWVPTEQVYLTSQFVPGKRQQDWHKALPFALEEQLSESIEALHIVPLNRDEESVVSAAVVSKNSMSAWVDQLELNGLSQAALLPDCFRLPEPQTVASPNSEGDENSKPVTEWSCFQTQNPDRMLVRQSAWLGFAGPSSVYETSLVLANQQAQVQSQMHDALSPGCELQNARSFKQACQRLNLRQNGYLPKNQSQALLKRWLWPLILLVFVFGVHLFNTYQETQHAKQQAAIYQAQTEALFKQRFPEVKRLINVRTQTKNQLAKNIGSSASELGSPLETLLQIEQALKAFKEVRVIEVEWQSKKRLSFTLQAPQLAMLETLTQTLQQTQTVELKMNQVSATQVEGVLYVDAN